MAGEFSTKACVVCEEPVIEGVPTIEEDVPGATVEQRFCSVDCYSEYLAHTAKRTETPAEYVRSELEEAGMDVEEFEQRQDKVSLFTDSE